MRAEAAGRATASSSSRGSAAAEASGIRGYCRRRENGVGPCLQRGGGAAGADDAVLFLTLVLLQHGAQKAY